MVKEWYTRATLCLVLSIPELCERRWKEQREWHIVVSDGQPFARSWNYSQSFKIWSIFGPMHSRSGKGKVISWHAKPQEFFLFAGVHPALQSTHCRRIASLFLARRWVPECILMHFARNWEESTYCTEIPRSSCTRYITLHHVTVQSEVRKWLFVFARLVFVWICMQAG